MGTAILPDEQLETKTARARREWNEAWSSIAASRRIWQIAAGVEALTVMACVFGLIHLGSLAKQVPYVVTLDKNGNAGYLGKPDEMSTATWDLVRVQAIRQFITAWRTVTADQTAQQIDYERSFAYIGNGSPANSMLTAWYGEHDPIQRALRGETVTTQFKTFDREGDNTFGVWFEETTSPGVGQPAIRKLYRARVTYAMRIPTNEKAREENPLGVLITELSVEEVH